MKKLFLITYFALSLSASNCHKLIAASPNLLEALIKISNELRGGNYKGNHVNGMVQMAEEAIYKATN